MEGSKLFFFCEGLCLKREPLFWLVNWVVCVLASSILLLVFFFFKTSFARAILHTWLVCVSFSWPVTSSSLRMRAVVSSQLGGLRKPQAAPGAMHSNGSNNGTGGGSNNITRYGTLDVPVDGKFSFVGLVLRCHVERGHQVALMRDAPLGRVIRIHLPPRWSALVADHLYCVCGKGSPIQLPLVLKDPSAGVVAAVQPLHVDFEITLTEADQCSQVIVGEATKRLFRPPPESVVTIRDLAIARGTVRSVVGVIVEKMPNGRITLMDASLSRIVLQPAPDLVRTCKLWTVVSALGWRVGDGTLTSGFMS